MNMTMILIVAAVLTAIVVLCDLTHPLPTPNAATASVLDPQMPSRAPEPCSATNPHRVVLSELGTWWYCEHDGCDELWPADEVHHALDLPYDREAVQLVDETEQYLRRVS